MEGKPNINIGRLENATRKGVALLSSATGFSSSDKSCNPVFG